MTFPKPYTPAETRYDSMPYRKCGHSGIKLPAITLGLWQNFGGEDVFETGRAILRHAFDMALIILISPIITARLTDRRKRISAGFWRRTSKTTETS